MFVNSQNSPASLLERQTNDWGLTVENGVHWFLAPNGEKFYGAGVNGVDAGNRPEQVEGRPAYYLWNLYASTDLWAANSTRASREMGFQSSRSLEFL